MSEGKRIRLIRIKSGVVTRLLKEKVYYEKEVAAQRVKIDKMQEQGEDNADLNKQYEVLQESLAMVPDSQRRLSAAVTSLKGLLVESQEHLKDSVEFSAALRVVEEAAIHLPE